MRPPINENKALIEFLRRTKSKAFVDLTDPNFPRQREFIRDPARFKAAQCTRRAAKSYADGIGLYEAAVNFPRVSCLYVALTVESARNIMIKDIMEPLNERHNLKARFFERPLHIAMPNGSIIYFTGVDASEKEKKKLWGQKYKRVIVDEGGGYMINVDELINAILRPTLIDYQGDLWFTGMPTNNVNSYFYDVVTGKVKGWAVHQWSALENPYIASKFQTEMDELIRENPLVVEVPWFRQSFLNEWVIDLSALVYRFSEERNVAKELPVSKEPWKYVLGVDLGYEDDTAFSIPAFNDHVKDLYCVESFKKKGMDIFEVADEIKRLEKKYPIYKIKIDGSNKQAVETMRKRLGLPYMESADKQGKAEHIEIMNSEMIQGKIKFIQGACDPLIKEMKELIWDEKKEKKTEHSACANHCCDAWLYGWRETYNYLSEKPSEKPKPTSDEYMKEWLQKESEKHKKDKEIPWFER